MAFGGHVCYFWEVLGPKIDPKSHVKLVPKLVPKLITFWTSFGPILGSISEPKAAPEGNQKWDQFWNHVPAHLRGSGDAFPGIKREVCKGYWNWNYTLQKKGRDHDVSH